MAYEAYVSIKGAKQGQFKGGELPGKRRGKWMRVVAFDMDLRSPRDLSTGQPSGKRQFEPVVIVKQWDAASPQALAACATDEILPDVVIEFTKITPSGQEYVYERVKLTDASIADVSRFTRDFNDKGDESGHNSPPNMTGLERWSFTFRRIQVEDEDGKTSFQDDWSGQR